MLHNGHNFHGGTRYSYIDNEQVPNDIKFRFQEKFGKKLMIWAAISEIGIADVYYHVSNGAMNSDIYISECIEKRLKKFIEKHGEHRVIFWPDLASSHYAAKTLLKLEQLSINVVPKDCNPPNVPQLRPIETFWSHLKARVYADGFQAKNTEELIARIKSQLKKFDSAYYKRLMKNMKNKIDLSCENGLNYIREYL